MKASLACPYSWDVPGGVQEHIRNLAEALMDLEHEVSVISPAEDDELLPDSVVPAGRAVSVPLWGSETRSRGSGLRFRLWCPQRDSNPCCHLESVEQAFRS